jgi:transposase InsO family protein
MVDNGCCTYSIVTEEVVRTNNLPRIKIPPILVEGVNKQKSPVSVITEFTLDVGGLKQKAAAYVMPSACNYDIILGKTWLERVGGIIDSDKQTLTLSKHGFSVRSTESQEIRVKCYPISAAAFQFHVRRNRGRKEKVQIFAASLKDIEKALQPKAPLTKTDVLKRLPDYLQSYADLFLPTEGEELPPLRGPDVDHRIELELQDGKEPKVPYGPLYNMSRDELLVLRKTLHELLDKGFIRASSSPAASPVLFVRKPGGGLRFCVDYRALNAITKKDRYPLPLVRETLNQIGRAKWYTKLDVTAAFHKIRITEGQEWMTAFRTRFGSYEWLVTPFGLANAPSTFQRYVNWTLREFLDDFVSAYLDDIIIFTDGSLSQHHAHVRTILDRLKEAGLQLELKKCEFDVTRTKYLGFIVEVGKGTSMDPEKVEAIQEWQAPTTVRGVRGFLGFANFYRKFIPHFARHAEPLVQLTKKDAKFTWGQEQEKSFRTLKDAFLSEEVLVPFDPERRTILECDSSGHAIGGTLSQEDENGVLRTVAYLSKKLLSHEANYPIHDKELLAVIYCLKEWDAELRGVREFEVITDHKNLEYFTKKQKMTERHVRWSVELSRFSNMRIHYRPGKENVRADALSRRDQDLPQDNSDDRITTREFVMLAPVQRQEVVGMFPVQLDQEPLISPTLPQPPNEEELLSRYWTTAQAEDATYQEVLHAVREGQRSLSTTRKIAVSLSDCLVDGEGRLQWRNRVWVPESEPLRTGIVQIAHLSLQTGHPGREETYRIVAREWYWPKMSDDIRRFVRNCELCRKSTPWRDGRHGYLRPLPVPSRTWQHLTVDFITGLPLSQGNSNLMVVKDRLSKGVVLIPMAKIETPDVAWAFVREVYRHHSFPVSITSDRGPQFASALWGDICTLLGIKRNLSTAYHPQTDGTTERANSDVEVVVRVFCNNDQDNWATLCPVLELMLNSRTNSTTGVSPFFLQHGYHNTPFSQAEALNRTTANATATISTQDKAKEIVRVITKAADWAISAMSYAQQEQERQANKSRKPAPTYKVGDWVWLDLRDVRTTRTSKKLDWKCEKFQVSRVRDPYWVELATPWATKTYHVDKLRPAAEDPLPSQQTNDLNPAAVVVQDEGEQEEHLEWQVESITDERTRQGAKQYLVKWVGFQEATWEPEKNLANTAALQSWLTRTQAVRLPTGSRRRRRNQQSRQLSRQHQRTAPHQQKEREQHDRPYENENQEELLRR